MIIENEKISVIVPIYNVEKMLPRCLESIINNSYRDIEIICVNDGSPDNSSQVLEEYEQKDNRIVVISKENGGLSSARNAGLRVATGKYITFIDSDDWVHPYYFEILLHGFTDDSIDLSICGFEQVNEYSDNYKDYSKNELENASWVITIDELLHNKIYKMFKVYSCGVMYKRDRIYHFFPEGIKVIEDNIFNLLNLPLYEKASIINLPIYYYYNNQESVMHTYSCKDAFKGIVWLTDFLQQENNIRKQKIEIVDFIYKRCMFYRFIFSKLGKKEEAQEYSEKIFVIARKSDNCLGMIKKYVFRVFAFFPFLYSIMKSLRGDSKSSENIFSLADGKLININK